MNSLNNEFNKIDHVSCDNKDIKKVMIITLYCGENEINECIKSIKNQSYENIEHVIFKYLPKKIAHEKLFTTFLSSDSDLLIKVDADMVLLDDNFVRKVVNIFKKSKNLSLLAMSISDYYSNSPIQGINAYSKNFEWKKEEQDKLFTDRVRVKKSNTHTVWTSFLNSVIHAPYSSNFQSYHFGVHRALKINKSIEDNNHEMAIIQFQTLENTWIHFTKNRKLNLLYALLGAELAFRYFYDVKHVDYSDDKMSRDFEKWSKLSVDKIEKRVVGLRKETLENNTLQFLRDNRKAICSERKIRTALFILLPGNKTDNLSWLENLIISLNKKNILCYITSENNHLSSENCFQYFKSKSIPVHNTPVNEAVSKNWDILICLDRECNLVSKINLFSKGISVLFLLKNNVQELCFSQSTYRNNFDLFFATASECFEKYAEFAPVLLQGGIDINIILHNIGQTRINTNILLYQENFFSMNKKFSDNNQCKKMPNSSLKIVHINTHDIAGGAAKSTWRLAESLRQRGHKADLLVGFKKSKHPSVHRFDPEPDQALAQRCHEKGLLFYEFQGSHKLVDHPLVKNADVIHLQNLHGGYFNPFSIASLSSIKPVVWTLRDMQSITGHCAHAFDCNRWQTGCGRCPDLSIEPAIKVDTTSKLWNDKKEIYSKSRLFIVCPSQWMKSLVEKSILANQHIELIYNSVDTDIFQPYEKKAARHEFGFPEDAIIIGSVAHGGSLNNQWKGGGYTLQALNTLWKKYPDLLFVNIGGNSNNKLSNNIIDVPHVDDETRLAKIYSALDMFIYTPLADTCPLVVIESLSCGLPVVSFATGGVPDLVRQGEDGFVTPYKDVRALAKAAETLIKMPMIRKQFSSSAREGALQRFCLEDMAAKYENLYYRAIKKHRHGQTFSSFNTSCKDLTSSDYNLQRNDKFSLLIGKTQFLTPLCEMKLPDSNISYARKEHFNIFNSRDILLYGKPIDSVQSDLKRYQDLFVLTFIDKHIPIGSRILEVGGGNSRILKHLASTYECWNIDKFEGVGSGPKQAKQSGYKIVLDYMGNNNPELQDDYFDFVFSISALEHTPNDPALHARILEDMDRVLRPGGFSLHLFDVVFKPEGFWTNPFLPYLFENAFPLFPMPDPEAMQNDADLYVMSKEAYDKGWKKITGKTYEEFGQPTSINILWRKALKSLETEHSESLPHNNKTTGTKPGPEILIPSTLPTISIVTPSFNQGEFLEECIDSILSQGYPNLEYVIMDGGSTDGSVEIIKRYEKHLKYWQSRKDSGQYWAINEGFKHTSGEIMAWLNSDDKYHAGAFNKVAYVFTDRPDVEWIVGRPTAWNEDGSLNRIFKDIPLWDYHGYVCEWPKKMFIQQESVFWRRCLWSKSGEYVRTDMQYSGDFELWIRFFRHAKLYSVDALLGGYRYQSKQKVGQNSEGYKKYLVEAVGVAKKELKYNLSNVKNNSAIVNDYISLDPGRHVDFQRSRNIYIEDTISVFTSLVPHEIDKQINAVASWRRMGFNVVSVNCLQEIGKLKDFFQDVEFVEAKRDGRQLFGKPLVYFDDILKTALQRNDTIFGIINSDIILQSKLNIRQLLLSEAKGSLFYGRREDVEKIEDNFGELYHVGFDCFFFDRLAARKYPKTEFCIGVPWWDYWAILMPLLHGIRIKCINRSGIRLLHVLHDTKWSIDSWLNCGNIMTNEIYAHISRIPRNQAVDLLSKRFSSGFFHSLHSDCNNLFLETNFVRNAVNILGTNASPRIKTLRFFGTFILEFIHKHTHR